MPPSDMQRLELLEEASKAFGREPAETLMESLPPHDWEQIATKDDLAAQSDQIAAKIDGRFAALERRFAKIDGEFAKIDGRFTELRGEMQAMEGRLDRRASRDLYFIVATTVGTMLAFAASIWAALLRGPLG